MNLSLGSVNSSPTLKSHFLRKRKEIPLTFRRDDLWNGTLSLGVLEFLNRFRYASNDKDPSEG